MKPEKIIREKPNTTPNNYHFEAYLKSATGEPGFEIVTGFIKAWTLGQAKLKVIQHYKRFDTFIEIYHANMNTGDKYAF